ncbi:MULTISPECIES: LLM class flavin-dependent oxidoreductase [unclassified Rhodococcus (in: high G+C Gram-positive bacteria)]|uniref:LLM class flavin-dependent oxidoreductase n=1 Tax=unclassified Rhodococcus (in: high G+C Gram-positive bacteria) TaxID=192944 RepID=UPI000A789D66|nr:MULTISPECIES: LLM class flavin-dependent oxidoreductase [unclassified Rhodococcus (in: high G+C Gram-positive bacteria)]
MSTQRTEFGVGFGGTLPPESYAALARQLETHGFHVATAFGDLMMQPPAMVLAGMAQATERLRLGVGCFTPWTLHPVEIAGQMAYLDALSDGRAFLGLVRGAWMDQLGIDTSRALAAVADTLAVVNAVLRGDGNGYQGTTYSIAPGTTPYYPVLRPTLPLMIGTWSPKLAEFAGRHADEIQIGGCANAEMLPLIRQWASAGEESAGRAAGSVALVSTAVTVVDEDGDIARARARTEAALPMHAVAALDRTVDVDPELLSRMGALLRRHDFEGAGKLIPDELLHRFTFCGTPIEVAEHAAAVYDAGARRVEFDSPFGVTPERGVNLLGTEVLPVLRTLGYGLDD